MLRDAGAVPPSQTGQGGRASWEGKWDAGRHSSTSMRSLTGEVPGGQRTLAETKGGKPSYLINRSILGNSNKTLRAHTIVQVIELGFCLQFPPFLGLSFHPPMKLCPERSKQPRSNGYGDVSRCSPPVVKSNFIFKYRLRIISRDQPEGGRETVHRCCHF